MHNRYFLTPIHKNLRPPHMDAAISATVQMATDVELGNDVKVA